MARAHRTVRDARRDFLHRTSIRLVRENDVIVIEDLNVSGVVRNRHLARAISDCGWAEFRRQLAYKCERYGRHLNAATNILAAGQAVTACGAGVRHPGTSRLRPAVKQETRPLTAGIPVLQGGE